MDPQRIGKYRIDGVLGSGAMGIVYRGFDPGVGRAVAIKVVRKELLESGSAWNAVERFRREARAAGRLSHTNIVTVHDFGEDAERAFLVCEYVDGVGLDAWLAEHGRVDLPRLMSWMGQLLAALEHAHAHGVVHRDVKPANLLLVRGRHLKLADFGIAQLDASDLTQGRVMIGTPSSMAPEQIRGEPVDARADVFAAGVLLYALLTGRRPFTGPTEAAMQQILDHSPTPPSQVEASVPAAFDEVVARALAKAPDQRFQSAGDFLAALRAAARAAGLNRRSDLEPEDATLVLPRDGMTSDARMPVHDAAAWDCVALEQIEAHLSLHVGPMAHRWVRKASERSATLGELAEHLAQHIPSESARAQFRAAVGAANSGGGSGGGVSRSHATTQPAASAPAPAAALDPASIARVQGQLAVIIGPMASLAIRRALKETSTLQGLARRVSEHVPDAGARGRFLAEFGVSTSSLKLPSEVIHGHEPETAIARRPSR